jgi:hypothetical protein
MTSRHQHLALKLAATALLLAAAPSASLAKGHGYTREPGYMGNNGGVLSNMKIIPCPPAGTSVATLPAVSGWRSVETLAAMHFVGAKSVPASTGGQTLSCYYSGPNGGGPIDMAYSQVVTGMSCKVENKGFSCWLQGKGQ